METPATWRSKITKTKPLMIKSLREKILNGLVCRKFFSCVNNTILKSLKQFFSPISIILPTHFCLFLFSGVILSLAFSHFFFSLSLTHLHLLNLFLMDFRSSFLMKVCFCCSSVQTSFILSTLSATGSSCCRCFLER